MNKLKAISTVGHYYYKRTEHFISLREKYKFDISQNIYTITRGTEEKFTGKNRGVKEALDYVKIKI